jgi:Holliday junction resolvase RusA-like endonuclease
MAKRKQKQVTLSVPLYVMIPRKTMPPRKYILNLNYYRNWQGHESNNIKIAYKDLLKSTLENLKFPYRITIDFQLWKGTARRTDRANVLSIHEKFFCDALTEFGCIPDDNDNYIVSQRYSTGGIDRENPRVDITITEYLETP